MRRPFAEAIFRILKPEGILACYTGVAHLPEFLDAFREAASSTSGRSWAAGR